MKKKLIVLVASIITVVAMCVPVSAGPANAPTPPPPSCMRVARSAAICCVADVTDCK